MPASCLVGIQIDGVSRAPDRCGESLVSRRPNSPEHRAPLVRKRRIDLHRSRPLAADLCDPTPDECLASVVQAERVFRRSIFVVEDIAAGEIFTAQNVRVIRPGYGMAPRHLDAILGKKATSKIERGTPLRPEAIDDPPTGTGE